MTLLESSAAGKTLAERLDALGARIQFGDNPYVPQDDYLLSPAFAFVRLEAPAGSIEEAASLVVSHCLSSPVTEADLDEAKKSLAREVGMRSASAPYTMRSTMWGSLLGGHPFAAPLFPAPPVIMQAGLDDLQSLRGRLFAGGNVVATLVSPEAPSEGCETLRKIFGGVPAGPGIECPSRFPIRRSRLDREGNAQGDRLRRGRLARAEREARPARVVPRRGRSALETRCSSS